MLSEHIVGLSNEYFQRRDGTVRTRSEIDLPAADLFTDIYARTGTVINTQTFLTFAHLV